MTVKELIEKLEQCPDYYDVTVISENIDVDICFTDIDWGNNKFKIVL